jgi:hypothetical protein
MAVVVVMIVSTAYSQVVEVELQVDDGSESVWLAVGSDQYRPAQFCTHKIEEHDMVDGIDRCKKECEDWTTSEVAPNECVGIAYGLEEEQNQYYYEEEGTSLSTDVHRDVCYLLVALPEVTISCNAKLTEATCYAAGCQTWLIQPIAVQCWEAAPPCELDGCTEGGGDDSDCCATCGNGNCYEGFVFGGQHPANLHESFEGFYPRCSPGGDVHLGCGNTCCISDANIAAAAGAAVVACESFIIPNLSFEYALLWVPGGASPQEMIGAAIGSEVVFWEEVKVAEIAALPDCVPNQEPKTFVVNTLDECRTSCADSEECVGISYILWAEISCRLSDQLACKIASDDEHDTAVSNFNSGNEHCLSTRSKTEFKLLMTDCSGEGDDDTDIRWLWNPGTKVLKHKTLCLESQGDTIGVHMSECGKNDNQLWSYNETTGLLKSNMGLCLAKHLTAEEISVTQSKCDEGNTTQHWSFPGVVDEVYERKHFFSGAFSIESATPSFPCCISPEVQ